MVCIRRDIFFPIGKNLFFLPCKTSINRPTCSVHQSSLRIFRHGNGQAWTILQRYSPPQSLKKGAHSSIQIKAIPNLTMSSGYKPFLSLVTRQKGSYCQMKSSMSGIKKARYLVNTASKERSVANEFAASFTKILYFTAFSITWTPTQRKHHFHPPSLFYSGKKSWAHLASSARSTFTVQTVTVARTTTEKKTKACRWNAEDSLFANSPLAVRLPRIRANPAQSFASCAHFRARVPRSELRPLKYLI